MPFISPITAESLESRLLFTVQLSLTGGVLLLQETSDNASTSITIQPINASAGLKIDVAGDSMTEDNALSNLGWTFNSDLSIFSGPETGINGIVIDNDTGSDNITIPAINLPVTIQPRGAAHEDISLGQTDTPPPASRISRRRPSASSRRQMRIRRMA